MNDVFGFVSLIVLGCGVYTLYAYIKMKKTGEINENPSVRQCLCCEKM